MHAIGMGVLPLVDMDEAARVGDDTGIVQAEAIAVGLATRGKNQGIEGPAGFAGRIDHAYL